MVGAAFGLGFIFGPAIGGVLAPVRTCQTPMWLAVRAVLSPTFVAAVVLRCPNPGHGSMPRRQDASSRTRGVPARSARRQPGAADAAARCSSSSRLAFSGFQRQRSRSSPRRRFGFTAATIGYICSRSSGSSWRSMQRAARRASVVTANAASAGSSPLALGLVGVGRLLGLLPFVPTACRLLLIAVVRSHRRRHGLQQSGAHRPPVSRLADPGEQGGILGLAQSLAALGRIAGPAWGGFLFERLGSTMPYVSAASIMFCALLLAIAGVRRSHLAAVKSGPEPQRPEKKETRILL